MLEVTAIFDLCLTLEHTQNMLGVRCTCNPNIRPGVNTVPPNIAGFHAQTQLTSCILLAGGNTFGTSPVEALRSSSIPMMSTGRSQAIETALLSLHLKRFC